jgi:putative endonuclease
MQKNQQHFFVYIFGDQPGSDVQIGIADNLQQKVIKKNTSLHQDSRPEKSIRLVYYEHYEEESVALNRERQIKSGDKNTTFDLIASMNPNWLDLSDTL